jgi:hypothetical protein
MLRRHKVETPARNNRCFLAFSELTRVILLSNHGEMETISLIISLDASDYLEVFVYQPNNNPE